MSFKEEELKKRNLPPVLPQGGPLTPEQWQVRRAELLKLLSEQVYGFMPPEFASVPWRVELNKKDTGHTCAGKVETRLYNLILSLPDGEEYTVPFVFHLPLRVNKPAVILHIAFRTAYPDRYLPVEEITDRGYALVHFCYNEATPDKMHGDYSQGLAAHMIHQPRSLYEWGDIGIWAFVASRLMDWLETVDEIDSRCVSVSGHSRLGKTALWCAAQDERFYCVFGNGNGYAGSGLIRGKVGEDLEDFFTFGSWSWFCENYKSYRGHAYEELPYDMHFLLAAIAPRHFYIGSAEDDPCMDYKSDYLSAEAASEVYRALGLPGLIAPDRFLEPDGPSAIEGTVGCHVRRGRHYLSRDDWNRFMDFLDAKRAEDGK